jgi:hypothetical protein
MSALLKRWYAHLPCSFLKSQRMKYLSKVVIFYAIAVLLGCYPAKVLCSNDGASKDHARVKEKDVGHHTHSSTVVHTDPKAGMLPLNPPTAESHGYRRYPQRLQTFFRTNYRAPGTSQSPSGIDANSAGTIQLHESQKEKTHKHGSDSPTGPLRLFQIFLSTLRNPDWVAGPP